MSHRWWIYQCERFPVLGHGMLIAVFSFSAVSYSSLLRVSGILPSPKSLLIAFATTFLFFLQLRVADEFKDYEDDSRYRPYRPVPRGLVTLNELKVIGIGAAVVQLALAIWLDPVAIPLLALVWLYLSLMRKEFFVPRWLKRRPFTYMWTHMIILPLLTLYASACDWLVANAQPPSGLGWFLGVSFFNGIVIEIGRKLRAPADEEHGVETYSALWGLKSAVALWLSALVLTAASALTAARQIGILAFLVALVMALLLFAAIAAGMFLINPTTKHSKLFPAVSGLWTLVIYGALAAPLWLVGRIF